MTKYVTDTSVIIEHAVSKLVAEKKISGELLVPRAVLAELEHQANTGQDIGTLGLEELQTLQELQKQGFIKIEFIGNRPNLYQIENAKSGGEVDSLIRDLAFENDAVLITADKIQSESAKAVGVKVHFVSLAVTGGLKLEQYFDDKTMSLHLKAGVVPLAKRGSPGDWKLTPIGTKILSAQEVENIAKDVVEKSRSDPQAFIEIARQGSTIVQYHNFRIVIVKPPVADGWEITAVRPIISLELKDYDLPDVVLQRIKDQARGIIIAGETGSGKSTFATAVAREYASQGKIVKTVESPRDLVLPDVVTQYSKNFTTSEEIHDILFLVRPDNLLFDEVRDTPDFKLYTDLRLGGSNCMGVLHGASAIDAIQRFIGRLDTGVIPSVLDTIIFMAKGKIEKIYSIRMTVKVPSGMVEADLARPVVEVSDFVSGKCEFEIYSYGEETVVVPVQNTSAVSPARNLAAKQIEHELSKFVDRVRVEVIDEHKARIFVPEGDIPRIIGKQGKTISEIEKKLGIGLDVEALEEKSSDGKGHPVAFDVREAGNNIIFYGKPGETYDVFVNGQFLFTGTTGKKGELRVSSKSKLGDTIRSALSSKKKIELRTA